MSRKIVMTLVCILVLGLSGCGDTLTLNQYNTSEIWYIGCISLLIVGGLIMIRKEIK